MFDYILNKPLIIFLPTAFGEDKINWRQISDSMHTTIGT